MENYLDQLNEAQRAAVEYIDGPELVIAGAGSGKTRVLTYKIVHLLHKGYHPRRIMALTFTNKAAREMRSRIEELVGPQLSSRLWMGTFHSIFGRILRIFADRVGYSSNFTIYDSGDSKSLVRLIIKDLGLDEKIYRPGHIAADISRAKDELMSPADYMRDRRIQERDMRNQRPRTGEIYAIYEERCRLAGAMDFDDLLYRTYLLITTQQDVREQLQEMFTYILVDEYQDTNTVQHNILNLLSGKHRRICVVGDDAQSIYSFRGAVIGNILGLERIFPDLKVFFLEQNYRSTQAIVEAANSLIANNTQQRSKHSFSENGRGDLVEVALCQNEYGEAYAVATGIRSLAMRRGAKLDEIAVLYRTNAQSRLIEDALRSRNILYRIYGGLSFYQRAEIKDAVSYLRVCVNPDDDEALRRIINLPARGIGDTTMKKVSACAIRSKVSLWSVILNPERYGLDVARNTAGKLKNFADMISAFNSDFRQGVNASALVSTILQKSGLAGLYLSDSTTPEGISKKENILELVKAVAEFVQGRISQEGENAAVGLQDFLAEISLLTDQDEDDNTPQPKVTLMTIHAAKGLEFDNVFIVGAEEELFPSSRCQTPAEIEEERRLMYVAITRARLRCFIFYAAKRTLNGITRQCMPSRFISDIDPRWLTAATGTHIPRRTQQTSPVSKPVHSSTPQPFTTSPGKVPPAVAPRPLMSMKTAASSSGSSNTDKKHTMDELRVGMQIDHTVFHHGVITAIDTTQSDTRLSVKFADGNVRTLLLKFARFDIIS